MLLGALAMVGLLAPAGAGARPLAPPRAHAASSYMTGIGDEDAHMFRNSHWTRLHTRIVR
ncbi:MAG: hypothetical protein QOI89_2651, partial [Solirubrobacteraceae bacterium]|nr:hypothetical protein [Solirubrobacteraceae bacterium]